MAEAMIKRRNLGLQVLWTILTCGLYVIYWFHVVNEEMARSLKREENLVLWTILFGFPPFCLYSYFKQGQLYEAFTHGEVNRWVIFILWLFFPPAIWIMVQLRLNEMASKQEKLSAVS